MARLNETRAYIFDSKVSNRFTFRRFIYLNHFIMFRKKNTQTQRKNVTKTMQTDEKN